MDIIIDTFKLKQKSNTFFVMFQEPEIVGITPTSFSLPQESNHKIKQGHKYKKVFQDFEKVLKQTLCEPSDL